MEEEAKRLQREHADSLINDRWSDETIARLCGNGKEIYTIKFDPVYNAWAVWFNGSWQGPGYDTLERAKQAARRMCVSLPRGYRMKWEATENDGLRTTVDRNAAWVEAQVEITQPSSGSSARALVLLLHKKGVPAAVVDRGKQAPTRWGISVLTEYVDEAREFLRVAGGPR